MAVIGGLCLGGGIVSSLVVGGASHGMVATGSSFDFVFLRKTWWRMAVVVVLCITVFAVLVGVNAGFVFLEESPDASGAAKDVVVVFFALLHEGLDHIATPLIVSVLVAVATNNNGRGALVWPSAVFATSVAVEMLNSVIAPMIALLGVSDGCFRDKIFASPEPVDTFVNVDYCPGGWTNASSCVSHGWHWLSYPAGVTYTPPFRFDGQRCISSIIT